MNMNINESREYKAAKELERVLNDYSFNPDLDLSDYMKVSNVSGSVLITI